MNLHRQKFFGSFFQKRTSFLLEPRRIRAIRESGWRTIKTQQANPVEDCSVPQGGCYHLDYGGLAGAVRRPRAGSADLYSDAGCRSFPGDAGGTAWSAAMDSLSEPCDLISDRIAQR